VVAYSNSFVDSINGIRREVKVVHDPEYSVMVRGVKADVNSTIRAEKSFKKNILKDHEDSSFGS